MSSSPELNFATAPDLLTIEEAAALLRIGRRQAYEAVRRGDLPALRLGRTIRVPKVALRRLLETTPSAG